jgi:quinolinate synthase
MSFGGHVLDMINRIKQNRELLIAPRERVRFVRKKYEEFDIRKYSDSKPIHKKVTKEELEAIRKRVRRDFLVLNLKRVALTLVLAVLIVYAFSKLMEL